jgi:site-specific DNA-methyltransferase (adenine-specific)
MQPMAKSQPATQFTVQDKTKWQHLYKVVQADCFEWLDEHAPNSIHAIVTDPPYGLKEYTTKEKTKLRRGRGGVWRIPPKLDGYIRSPLPRFTVLTEDDKDALKLFTDGLAKSTGALPGGHVFCH